MNQELARAKKLMKMALEPEGEPSFADKLANGVVDWESLFGLKINEPFDGSEFDNLFSWLKNFLEKEVDPAEIERTVKIAPKIFETLAAKLLGAKIPQPYSGLGLSTTQYCLLMELLSSCHPALGIWFTANCSIGLSGYLLVVFNELKKELKELDLKFIKSTDQNEKNKIEADIKELITVKNRTEWQMSEFLPKMARGANAGFGLTQVTAGSDPAAMIGTDTIACRIDNEKIHLRGHKLYNTNATIAEYEVVMAPLAPKNKMCAFIVPTKGYGKFEVVPLDFSGNKGIENGLMIFDVVIPENFIVGKEGEGLKNALKTLNVGRLAMAAGSLATIAQCLEISRWWCKVRVQMDLPIGQYKQNAIRVAKMACNKFAIEAIMRIGSSVYDKFKSKQDLRLMTAAIKLWSTEAAFDSALNENKIRSGRAYETYESQVRRHKLVVPNEIPLPDDRFISDSQVLLIGEGTSDIQKLVIFGVMTLPHIARLMPVVDSETPPSKRVAAVAKLPYYIPWVISRLVKILFTDFFVSVKAPPKLKKHLIYITRQSQLIALKLFKNLVLSYRLRLFKENIVTGFMAKQLTELWVMSAVCRYAVELQEKYGDVVVDIADVFCGYARCRIRGLGEDVPEPETDDKAYKLAQNIIFGQKAQDGSVTFPAQFLEERMISILQREKGRYGTEVGYC